MAQFSSGVSNEKNEFLSDDCFVHKWKINNFNFDMAYAYNQPLRSPPFKINIKGQGDREFWIEISQVENKVHFKVHFSLPTSIGGCWFGFKKNSLKSKLDGFPRNLYSVVDKHLTFQFESHQLSLVGDALEMYLHCRIQTANPIAETTPTQIEMNRDELEFLSDFEIKCEGRTFQVHKVVLATHSDVFRAMFTHKDTEENKKNKVKILDLSAETMDSMLQVMYTQKLPDNLTQTDLEALLEASNKYNFCYLNSLCENRLKTRFLNTENSARLMLIGLKFNSKALADKAKQMVMDNSKQVIQTKEFEELVREYPDAFTTKSEGTKKRKALGD